MHAFLQQTMKSIVFSVAQESCSGDNALGMEIGSIRDDQIHMTYSFSGSINKKGRLNGDYWCGLLWPYHGEVSVQIRFKSVVKVKSVLFQMDDASLKSFRITKVAFRYYDADNPKRLFTQSKVNIVFLFFAFYHF